MSTLRKQLTVKENYKALDNLIRGGKIGEEYRSTEDGGVKVTNELIEQSLTHKINLSEYATIVEPKGSAGTYPYLDLTGTTLEEVAELEAGAEMPCPKVTPIKYEIKTYRGIIPVSYELVDDAEVDLAKILTVNAKQADINAKNRETVKIFKTATPKAVAGTSELISLVNKGFKSAYDVKLFVSASLYDVLDNDGMISYENGIRFKGHDIIKLDDTMIGEAEGDLVGFIGDARRFIFIFDKQAITVKEYINTELFYSLICSSRFDIQKGDEQAGVYITFSS